MSVSNETMPQESENTDETVVSCMCHCGRKPKRLGQRNCHLCHAEANRKYRASLRKQAAAFRKITAAIDGAA